MNQSSDTSTPNSRAVGRPLGVTLAIFCGVLLFVIMPLLEVAVILLLDSTFIIDNGVGMSGINISGLNQVAIVFQIVLSLGYFMVAIITFSGRIAMMRYIFPLVTLILTLMHIGLRIIPRLSQPQTLSSGIDSAGEFAQYYLSTHLILMILVTIYSIWFLNRWSARAFFRRYYTDAEKL